MRPGSNHSPDLFPTLALTANVLQHGLDGTATLPRKDWIASSDLSALTPHFPELRGDCRVQWQSPRPFSAAALVAGSHGAIFIKRTDARQRTEEDLFLEHAFLRHLSAGDVPVVCARPSRQHGRTVIAGSGATGSCWYEVFAGAPGMDLYRDVHSWQAPLAPDHSRHLGAALARLHAAAADFPHGGRPARPLLQVNDWLRQPDPALAWQTLLSRRPLARASLADRPGFADRCLEWLAPWFRQAADAVTGLPDCWIHQDGHVSNLFWDSPSDDAEVASWLDFGGANRGWPILDLAIAIERNCIAWLDLAPGQGAGDTLGRTGHLRQLIAGYCGVRELTGPECRALPALLPLCQIDFALSEIDYFLGVTGSCKDADLARDGFLEAHLSWFGSEAGREFLDAVQDALP